MAGRKKGSKNASPEQIREALSLTARLGDAEEAARQLKMPARTLQHWKQRHPDIFAEVCAEHAREVRERHAKNVERAWQDFAEAAKIAAEKIKAGDYDGAKDFRAFAATIGDFARSADHAARLDADKPTSITETRTRAELLDEVQEHLQRVRAMGLDIDDANLSHTLGERH